MTTHLRRIAVVAAAAALVVVAAWYLLLWGPQARKVALAHRARATAQAQVGQLRGQVGALQGLVRRIPADTASLKALEAALPNNPSLDSALLQLQQIAVSTGVGLMSVSPTPPAGTAGGASSAPAPGGPSITLAMSATGSYQQLTAFLSGLASMPRAVVVDRLSLSGTSKLTAAISARIFYAGGPTP